MLYRVSHVHITLKEFLSGVSRHSDALFVPVCSPLSLRCHWMEHSRTAPQATSAGFVPLFHRFTPSRCPWQYCWIERRANSQFSLIRARMFQGTRMVAVYALASCLPYYTQ